MATDLHLPHQFAAAEKTLTAACHCKSVQFTVAVPTSALPLPVHLCHCSICRYTHGTFACFHAALPKGVEPEFIPPSPESALTGYIHSDQAASERLFCNTCGCHIGDRDLKPNPDTGRPDWRVTTSIFAAHDEDTFQIRSHWFTDASTEPNLSTWLPSINSRAIHAWNPAPSDSHFPLASAPPPKPSNPPSDQDQDQNHDKADALLAQCHCAGVRFTIPRPSPKEAADPFLSRYLKSSATPLPENGPNDKATGPATLKRVACVCLCKDCRLTSGAHAVPWTSVPLASITPQVPPGLEGFGTLKAYRSSEKVTRGFCGVCGATVFYEHDDEGERGPKGEKRIVDVAVGILRDPRGKTAVEEWVTWRTGRCAGRESGREFDKGFAEGLAKGLGEWGVRRHGERTEFEIPLE